ncbi:hypothetical protein [Mucilaginibacter sp. OK098]|uniref:hypothetical protein n=1 Tax=Mucilaginibacter sp. OK098 TaxID=1855297 RepID=UPI0009111C7F|nr:hypothetical protein [Mucilaginibacter sp. OK098]SHN13688.1 hypothetical protein SAMN05216524_105537 [Mucilaginibacter sp. OK098]
MKPGPQQKQQLQEYLRKGLKYRETYEEVYDHILAALAYKPETSTFNSTVNEIIRDDFGGSKNLWRIEESFRKSVAKDMSKQFWQLFSAYLKFPLVVYTAIISAIVYYIIYNINVQPVAFERIFILFAFLPALLVPVRYYKIGYIFKDTKKSVRDNIFIWIAQFPLRLCICSNMLLLIYHKADFSFLGSLEPLILTIIIVAEITLSLAVIKLSSAEFKIIKSLTHQQ